MANFQQQIRSEPDIAPKTRTVQVRRVRFLKPIFVPKESTSVESWRGEPAMHPFEATVTPVGLERDGVLVPWGNVACVEWA